MLKSENRIERVVSPRNAAFVESRSMHRSRAPNKREDAVFLPLRHHIELRLSSGTVYVSRSILSESEKLELTLIRTGRRASRLGLLARHDALGLARLLGDLELLDAGVGSQRTLRLFALRIHKFVLVSRSVALECADALFDRLDTDRATVVAGCVLSRRMSVFVYAREV